MKRAYIASIFILFNLSHLYGQSPLETIRKYHIKSGTTWDIIDICKRPNGSDFDCGNTACIDTYVDAYYGTSDMTRFLESRKLMLKDLFSKGYREIIFSNVPPLDAVLADPVEDLTITLFRLDESGEIHMIKEY